MGIVHTERDLNCLVICQTKDSLLKYHTKFVEDNVLRPELELKVGATSHAKCNRYFMMVLDSSFSQFPVAYLRCIVADLIVQIFKSILTWIEERSKRIVVKKGVESLLVQCINVDIGCDSVTLCFSVRQPGLDITSNARVMNPMATFAEWTGGRA
jgi:hypothetical protein